MVSFFASVIACWGGVASPGSLGQESSTTHAHTSSATGPAATTANERVSLGIVAGDPVAVSLFVRHGSVWGSQLRAGWSTSAHRTWTASFDTVVRWTGAMPEVKGRGTLVPWFGLGARVSAIDEAREVDVGLRAPIGILFVEASPAVEFGVEVAPGFRLLAPTRVVLEGGLSIAVRL